MAGACVVALIAWQGTRWPGARDADDSPGESQRFQELLGAIERQLEVNDAIFDPVFPTDILLTQTETKYAP